MKDELAARLLAGIMNWDEKALSQYGPRLQNLAMVKYDDYGQYRPGERFVESLARWLLQFEAPADRETAIRFVLDDLVFVSRAELEHSIELVYPDYVRPLGRRVVAADLGASPFSVTAIVTNPNFRSFLRRSIVFGLSDGARLDKLRRASSDLSHEQFFPTHKMNESDARQSVSKLRTALERLELPGPATFRRVILVEDFSGSGFSLIRPSGEGEWEGKLADAKNNIKAKLGAEDALAEDVQYSLVLYFASQQAIEHVTEHTAAMGFDIDIHVVQTLDNDVRVSADAMVTLCRAYYDDRNDDEHKGSPVLGFQDCALPLVLEHNTPNNSIALLWADTSDREQPPTDEPFSLDTNDTMRAGREALSEPVPRACV